MAWKQMRQSLKSMVISRCGTASRFRPRDISASDFPCPPSPLTHPRLTLASSLAGPLRSTAAVEEGVHLGARGHARLRSRAGDGHGGGGGRISDRIALIGAAREREPEPRVEGIA